MIYDGIPGIAAGVFAAVPFAVFFYDDAMLSTDGESFWKLVTGCWGLAGCLALIQWLGLPWACLPIAIVAVEALVGRILAGLGLDKWVRGQFRRFEFMRRFEAWGENSPKGRL
jgi:hypothetical protein